MSKALGRAVWTTHPVASDVSGLARHIQVCSDYGNLRITTLPVQPYSAARAVDALTAELVRRKARAEYGTKH